MQVCFSFILVVWTILHTHLLCKKQIFELNEMLPRLPICIDFAVSTAIRFSLIRLCTCIGVGLRFPSQCRRSTLLSCNY